MCLQFVVLKSAYLYSLFILYQVVLCKADVALDLDELETAADIVQREEEAIAAASNQKSKSISHKAKVSLCKNVAALSLSEKKYELFSSITNQNILNIAYLHR